ncbi:MAG TPA: malectin [Verrucomicrobiae bacterium]|nr:malectin [Verrucomicrobiae bacterium]
MKNGFFVWVLVTAGAGCLLGCKSNPPQTAMPAAAPAAAPVIATPEPAPTIAASGGGVYRMDAGADQDFTDPQGNVWRADQGFDGGDVISRDPGLSITNTADAGLYLTEHYGMNAFSCRIPNGKYVARLHFAETFEGITGPGQRVFSFKVQGHEFKDFDVWAQAGGPYRALVESVPVEVTNGIFRIDFTSSIENPEINAIEIAPQP